jgi:pimeloyl-ACP methyl ester carboxylesterase
VLHYKVLNHSTCSDWMVFIHGAGGSINTWKYQEDYFKNHYNLLLVDLRDHGLSKNLHRADSAYTFELITADLLEVLDLLFIQKASFITLSFGSVLIQHFALRYPERIERCVFAGGIFSGGWLLKSAVYAALLLNKVLPYSLMYSTFSYVLMPRKRNQLARKIYQQQAALLTPNEYLRWVALYDQFFELLHDFRTSHLPFPALVVMGDEDYVFLSAANSFVEIQPNMELSILTRCGHICNIEKPSDFNALVLDFLMVLRSN